jgi:hypothetical protein
MAASLRPSSIPPVLVALPTLAPGVTLELLRRVWNATPEDRRHQRATLLDSIVPVKRGGVVYAKPLKDLTLAEVEAAIGAVTPKFFVRWYQHAARGVKGGEKVRTFINRKDAEDFVVGKNLHGRPAKVEPLTREGR